MTTKWVIPLRKRTRTMTGLPRARLESMRCVGWQVFVDVPDAVGRPPGGAVPVKPALVGVAAHGGEEPVELLRVGLDAVGLEDHRGRGDGAPGVAEGAVLGHAAERVVTPSFVALAE